MMDMTDWAKIDGMTSVINLFKWETDHIDSKADFCVQGSLLPQFCRSLMLVVFLYVNFFISSYQFVLIFIEFPTTD